MGQTFPELKEEYAQLWDEVSIRPERADSIEKVRKAVANSEARYQAVAAATNVPWYVIGIIHNLEASLSFKKHLHNGDPLTARTVQVPAGRPADGEPPFTWEESATDALRMHSLHKVEAWTVERIAFELERYNGWGYRKHHPDVKTPYLWSFSNLYTRGKYIADGKWSDTAVSEQVGGITLLRAMVDNGLSVPREGASSGQQQLSAVVSAGGGAASASAGGGGSSGGGGLGAGSSSSGAGPMGTPAYPGSVLRRGSPSLNLVKHIQAQLNSRGVGPIKADGDFGEATENAVSLFQSRFADSSGDSLDIDGVVGRKTWDALFGSTTAVPLQPHVAAATPLLREMLAVAATQVGVMEAPPGSNRGPVVDQFIASVGLNPAADSYPWCVCFIYWCFQHAADQLQRPNPLPRTAGVIRLWNDSVAAGAIRVTRDEALADPSRVTPGSIFCLSTGGGKGHAGLVVSHDGQALVTIEGNTNPGGSSNGIGVFRRQARTIAKINLGFIRFEN